MAGDHNRVSRPPTARPLLIYDGECVFCCRWIERWKVLTGSKIDYAPFQEAARQFPEIPLAEFSRAVQLVDREGMVYSGAEAVFSVFKEFPIRKVGIFCYRKSPLFARLSECAYALVARNRGGFSFLTRILWGENVEPPTYQFSSWLFLRLIGVIALFAFLSYWIQAEGLIGENGILPFPNLLEQVDRYWDQNAMAASKYWYYPTLLWLKPDNAALNGLFLAGTVSALFLAFGRAGPLAALMIWVSYLSLMTAGSVFLSFQWDILLLESVFLCAFLAPLARHDRLGARPPVSPLARWLIWLLLFKLMFESGLVKLTYYGLEGENTWRDFTALNYHYWSQPIPAWTSWHFHHFPAWMRKISLAFMFLVELVFPFLIWFPRRLKLLACAGLLLLQILIALSGNYGFFNLLAMVLCVPLIDDQSLPSFLREKVSRPTERKRVPPALRIPRLIVLLPFAALVLWMNVSFLKKDFAGNRPAPAKSSPSPPPWARAIRQKVSLLHTVNPYGLFRVMTETRPEIIIEGSSDGLAWKPYLFKWKPVDPTVSPPFFTPHMPRLDWQMWFAGLAVERNRSFRAAPPWLLRFLQELLKNNPAATSLLRENPFPEHPPRFMRLRLFHYSFSDPETKRETGAWWKRALLDRYTLQIKASP